RAPSASRARTSAARPASRAWSTRSRRSSSPRRGATRPRRASSSTGHEGGRSMILYHTPTSPFVRKVMIAAHELGLADRIETRFLRPVPTKADATLSCANPLNKIPALILDDGSALYDSPVIVEYLDSLHGAPRLVPASGPARWRVLRQQALCDGILDAAILVFYERATRPAELHWTA